jgi:DNA-binding MarR family transcriptional regulator
MKRAHNEVSPLAEDAFMRLLQLSLIFGDFVHRGMAERGLTVARAGLIWQLHHGGPLTQRALSRALRVTPRNVTGLVDALEAEDLVARTPHPTDRRATLVILTKRGERSATAMAADYRDGARQLFGTIDRAALAGFVTTVDAVLARLNAPTDASEGPPTRASAARPDRPTRTAAR